MLHQRLVDRAASAEGGAVRAVVQRLRDAPCAGRRRSRPCSRSASSPPSR
ncbi:MAG: hypothetical protein MZV49_22850 [Rhodopseudomonas palustris]|nr:hypothetical protein [Rhodopseudomonas palustris]